MHLFISKGLSTLQKKMNMLENDTYELFLECSRSFSSKPLTKEDVASFKSVVKHHEDFFCMDSTSLILQIVRLMRNITIVSLTI